MKAKKRLKEQGRVTRRSKAVDVTAARLGLEDMGRGHLDTLYEMAYADGLKDASALSVLHAQAQLDGSWGWSQSSLLAGGPAV